MWDWIKKSWAYVAIAASVVVGFFFYWRRREDKIDSLEDQLAVEKASKKVAHLEGSLSEQEKQIEEKKVEIITLQREREAVRQQLGQVHEATKGMTNEEVADAFRKLYGN
jgi:predicted HNH restriction endonuclease